MITTLAVLFLGFSILLYFVAQLYLTIKELEKRLDLVQKQIAQLQAVQLKQLTEHTTTEATKEPEGPKHVLSRTLSHKKSQTFQPSVDLSLELSPEQKATFFPLTDRDWTLILTNATKVSAPANEILQLEESRIETFWLLYGGTISIQTHQTELAILTGCGLIGEPSVFDTTHISGMTAITQTACVLFKIDLSLLRGFLQAQPEFSKRFYTMLGIQLSKKLDCSNQFLFGHRAVQVLQPENGGDAQKYSKSKDLDKDDILVQTRFELPETELVINSFPCFGFGRAGMLYITSRNICFYAKILAFVTKSIIPLGRVVAVAKLFPQSKEFRFSVIYVSGSKGGGTTKKLKFGFTSEQDLNAAYTLIEELSKAASHLDTPSNFIPQINLPESSGDLSKADWDKLLTDSNVIVHFKKREHLLKEGEYTHKIYQILSGTCTVMRIGPGRSNTAVGVLGPGDVAGEISFLTKKPSSAAVVAKTNVTAYAIDSNYIDTVLWEQDPQLVLRFCRYLCSALVTRVSGTIEKIKD